MELICLDTGILIAATAIKNNCKLATLNHKDFIRIMGLFII
jgi:predicted nucleic acid-binding protein